MNVTRENTLRLLVTPCAGVWIEIKKPVYTSPRPKVTPCAGVWIEIPPTSRTVHTPLVTPCAGVWIEIVIITGCAGKTGCHSLCGSVD